MTCKCGSNSVLKIDAKCNDMCSITYTDSSWDATQHGYVPRGLGIGGGDYVRLTICVDCGTVQNWKPFEADTALEAIESMQR